jgi:hypothetical protein
MDSAHGSTVRSMISPTARRQQSTCRCVRGSPFLSVYTRQCKWVSFTPILGTLLTLLLHQAMVFGNLGPTSGTGVLFSRNPSTGENHLYGEFLLDAQGEDVVAGFRHFLKKVCPFFKHKHLLSPSQPRNPSPKTMEKNIKNSLKSLGEYGVKIYAEHLYSLTSTQNIYIH